MILKKPFYVEKYPNFNTRELRNRIKVIALSDGYLHGHRKVLEHLAIEWRKKLESYVSYTLQEKLFSFEEEETPDGLYPDTLAKLDTVRDSEGILIPEEERLRRLRSGNWLLATITLYPSIWPEIN